MKLIEFDFNKIEQIGLTIFVDGELEASGFIGDVLKKIPHLKEREIKETRIYFDEFVIEV